MSAEANNDGGLPMRWRDDPQTSPALAALLASARADEPRAEQLAALRAALGVRVAASADDELARHRARRGRRPVVLGALLVAAAAATAIAVTRDRGTAPAQAPHQTVALPVPAGSGDAVVAGVPTPPTSRVIVRTEPPELNIYDGDATRLGQAPLGLTRPVGTTSTLRCGDAGTGDVDTVPPRSATIEVTWTAVDQVVLCEVPSLRDATAPDDKQTATDKASKKPSEKPSEKPSKKSTSKALFDDTENRADLRTKTAEPPREGDRVDDKVVVE